MSPPTRELLSVVQNDSVSFDSQLVELLGASMVRIVESAEDEVHLVDSERQFCERCRKLNRYDFFAGPSGS